MTDCKSGKPVASYVVFGYDSGQGSDAPNKGQVKLAAVRYRWSPVLVDLRREVCPAARWEKKGRQWVMSDQDADRFLRAAHARLGYGRSSAYIEVNGEAWIVGFVQGAPCRAPAATVEDIIARRSR